MTAISVWLVAVVLLCGLAGSRVPSLIARMRDERYEQVAEVPRLGQRAALVSAVAGGLIGAAIGLDWPLLFLLPLVPVSVALAFIDPRIRY